MDARDFSRSSPDGDQDTYAPAKKRRIPGACDACKRKKGELLDLFTIFMANLRVLVRCKNNIDLAAVRFNNAM